MRSLIVLAALLATPAVLLTRACDDYDERFDGPRDELRPNEEILRTEMVTSLGNARIGTYYTSGWSINLAVMGPGPYEHTVTVRKGDVFEAGGAAWRVTKIKSGLHGGAIVERAGPCTTSIGCGVAPPTRNQAR